MIPEPIAAPTLSVSIVLHQSDLAQLESTVRSLLASVRQARQQLAHPVSLRFHDNNSDVEYQAQLRALVSSLRDVCAPEIDLQLSLGSENIGFGRGHNHALAEQSAHYLLILNPDVDLMGEALAAALDYLQANPDVVAINPQCARGDGRREYLCKRYPSVLDLLLRGLPAMRLQQHFATRLARYEYRDRKQDQSAEVCLLSGAFLLCRGKVFAAVGGFSPRFFMYFEDFDLSLRLAAHGRLMYLPAVRIVHHGGFAARKGLRHIRWFAASALLFFRTHGWRLR